jgi:hypothetical protein
MRPIILQRNTTLQKTWCLDEDTMSEPLPSVVVHNADRTVRAGGTGITEVKQETTDEQ